DGLGRGRLDVAQDLDAVTVGELDVGDDEVDRPARQYVGRGAAAVREHHLEALLAQHDAEHLAHRGLVVNDEDRLLQSTLPVASDSTFDCRGCYSAPLSGSTTMLACRARRLASSAKP